MAHGGAQVSRLCRRLGLRPGQEVLAHDSRGHRGVADDDRATGSAVEAFLDRPHLAGAHDREEAGVDEDVDVVGDRRLRSVDRERQLRDGRGPFEHEVEDQAPQRMGKRLELLGCVGLDTWCEVVVGNHAADYIRLVSNDREKSNMISGRVWCSSGGAGHQNCTRHGVAAVIRRRWRRWPWHRPRVGRCRR